jgi:hypothetical protein
MKAKDNALGLRPIGRAQDSPQSRPWAHLITSSSRRVGADAHEVRRAQRDARLVTRESAAARGESIDLSQRQVHQEVSICPMVFCSCFVLTSRISWLLDTAPHGPFRSKTGACSSSFTITSSAAWGWFAHNAMLRNRSAFTMTLTDDKAIAAAAMIGESVIPQIG